MKFRAALAVLLTLCVMLGTVVVAFSATAEGYYYYEQNFSNAQSFTGSAINGRFVVESETAALKYDPEKAGENRVIVNTENGTNLTVGKVYRIQFGLAVTKAATGNVSMKFYGSSNRNIWNQKAALLNPQSNATVDFGSNLKTVGNYNCTATLTATQPVLLLNCGVTDAAFTVTNIVVREVFTEVAATVENNSGGTATVTNANVGLYGYTNAESALFSAQPDTGYVFRGWFNQNNERVSALAEFETPVTGPLTLQARFAEKSEQLFYGFEEGYTCQGNGKATAVLDHTVFHSGETSLKRTYAAASTDCFYLTPKTDDYKLEKGKSYYVTFYAYTDGGEKGGGTAPVYLNTANNASGWFTPAQDAPKIYIEQGSDFALYSYTFTALTSGHLSLYMGTGQKETVNKSFWFDDVKICPAVSVTFKPNNGEQETVLAGGVGNLLELPAAPKRNGYEFTGWYLDEACETPFEQTTFPQSNLTVWAGWKTARQVTVRFVTGNGATELPVQTGAAGAPLTVQVPQKNGCYFAGWFKNSSFTEAYPDLVFPAEDTTLYARFVENGVLTQNFESYDLPIQAGKFGIYTAKQQNDPYVAEGMHSMTCTVSGTVKIPLCDSYARLVPGNAYKITFKALAMNITGTGALSLMNHSDRQNPWGGQRDEWNVTTLNKGAAAENKWVEYSKTFVATQEYFGISMWGPITWYFDDFKITPVKTVTVTLQTQSGEVLTPLTGPAGSEMKVPTPAAPQGKSFAGWYLESACVNRYNAAYFPENDLTLYAKWITAGSFEQDFEAWNYKQGSGAMSQEFSLYTARSANDPNVYSGTHSVYFNINGSTKAKVITLFDESMGQMQIGEKYSVSFKIKPVQTELDKHASEGLTYQIFNTTQRENGWAYTSKGALLRHNAIAFYEPSITVDSYMGTSNLSATTLQKDANGWLTVTFEVTAVTPYLSMIFSTGGACSAYLDAVTITPFPNGTVDASYEKPYCEDFYNLLLDNGLGESMNQTGKKITKLQLDSRGDYVFSAALRQSGTAWLAWDAAGNDVITGTKFAASGSDYAMHSVRFIADKTGVVYLVTQGGGQGTCNYFALFPTRFAKESDPEPHLTYQKTDYSKLTEKSALSYGDGAPEDAKGEISATDETPATGDTGVVLPLVTVLLAAATMVALALKKGEKHETQF